MLTTSPLPAHLDAAVAQPLAQAARHQHKRAAARADHARATAFLVTDGVQPSNGFTPARMHAY